LAEIAYFHWVIAQRTLKELCGWWRYIGFWGGAITVVVEDVGLTLGFLTSIQPPLFYFY
jgi:hypothetical protein